MMNPFLAVMTAGFLARLSYQMARSPVPPRFAESLGAAPELIGMVVAASTVTGVLFCGSALYLPDRERCRRAARAALRTRVRDVAQAAPELSRTRCERILGRRYRRLRLRHKQPPCSQ